MWRPDAKINYTRSTFCLTSALYWIRLPLLIERICTRYEVSWCLTMVRFYRQLSWPQVCTGRDLSQRAAYWDKADLLEGWIKCITVHLNTDFVVWPSVLSIWQYFWTLFPFIGWLEQQNRLKLIFSYALSVYSGPRHWGQTPRQMHSYMSGGERQALRAC